MRGGNCAAVVGAVAKVERVAELVERFFEQSLALEGGVAFEAVKLLAQAMSGNYSRRAGHLRLSEDEGQNWNIEIVGSDAEQAPGIRSEVGLHAPEEIGGMKLTTLGVESKLRVEARLD